METVSYQTKADSLLCYLSEHGYSVGYVSIFRIECERIISCLTDLSTLGNYLQDYSLRFGVPLRPYRERIIRVILCYFEEGRLPSRQHPCGMGKPVMNCCRESIVRLRIRMQPALQTAGRLPRQGRCFPRCQCSCSISNSQEASCQL